MRPRRTNYTTDSSTQRKHRPDYTLLLIAAALLVVGLIVVYSISPGLAVQRKVSPGFFVFKQIIAILLGIGVFAVLSKVPFKFLKSILNPLIGLCLVSSMAVLFLGEKVNGAYRWIQIGGLSFQPVELIKFTLLIWMSGFMVSRARNHLLNDHDKTFKPLLLVVGGIGLLVAVFQSDLGSTAVIIAMMFAMAFLAGLPLKKVIMLGGIVAVGVILAISTSAYRRDRLLTFINPERDCIGSGYQTCQALIAVGSGGILGKGLNSSGQAFGYLPESANDSIFAIMSEKLGFVGMTIVLALYGALFARMIKIMEHTEDMESRLVVAGVLAWFSTQAMINIGAMVGLLPLKGITLPFISYGGTSVIFVSAAIALVFNISRYTRYEPLPTNFEDFPEEKAENRRYGLGYSTKRYR